MVRGRIEVNSFFSQTRSHPVGVLREEGGPFSGSQCRRGALFPLASQAQLCPVSEEPPPRNRAVCPCVVGRSQSCSVSSELLLHLTVAAACPSEGRLVSWGVWFSPGRPRKPKHHAGHLDLHFEARVQSPASLSPLLCLLPLSSDFEVKVKRANVPDLPDTVSWSGHLLGINKINLTKENRTRREREERQSPQIFGCEMK